MKPKTVQQTSLPLHVQSPGAGVVDLREGEMTTYHDLSTEELNRRMADNNKKLGDLYEHRLELQGDLQELSDKRVDKSSGEYQAKLKEIAQKESTIRGLNGENVVFLEELDRREKADES